MTTWEECKRQVLARADLTRKQIKARSCRADAFERVMTNHIRDTGYPPELKPALLELALGRTA